MQQDLKAEDLKGDWIARMVVDDRAKMPWEYIKKELIWRVSSQLVPAMLDSGYYHVVKLEMGSSPCYDNEHWYRGPHTEYFIRGRLSIAREERLIIPRLEPVLDVVWEGQQRKIDRVCLHCGNKLIHDARGGCSGCGAPNGGYKNGSAL